MTGLFFLWIGLFCLLIRSFFGFLLVCVHEVCLLLTESVNGGEVGVELIDGFLGNIISEVEAVVVGKA